MSESMGKMDPPIAAATSTKPVDQTDTSEATTTNNNARTEPAPSPPPQPIQSTQPNPPKPTNPPIVVGTGTGGIRFKPGQRKPVIYIFSPEERNVRVRLSLAKELRFSVVYPVVPVQREGEREWIEWNVRTKLGGNLIEKGTARELEVAYLFWESEIDTNAHGSTTTNYFSPSTCTLTDSDSVVLLSTTAPDYLERTLLALGLHTEARTSFITFWLPAMLKHTYVALRFVPQTSFELSAPLDVHPKPDVVTRVFMLFKGVSVSSLRTDWPRRLAERECDYWQNVVGVDLARASDPKLYRVLEWGGMEVLN